MGHNDMRDWNNYVSIGHSDMRHGHSEKNSNVRNARHSDGRLGAEV